MKRAVILIVCLLATSSLTHATVSVAIDAGALRNSSGATTVPVGGLLQLIASPSGVFSPPTSSSYITGDNVLVLNLSMNVNGGTGETLNTANFTLASTGSPYAGEEVALRWFPSLLTAGNAMTGYTPASASPGIGTMYGQYRSDAGETNGSNVGIAWTIPTDGTTLTTSHGWNFVTVSNNGATANAAGYAVNPVVPVPEPSAGALTGWTAAGLTVLWFWRWRLRAA